MYVESILSALKIAKKILLTKIKFSLYSYIFIEFVIIIIYDSYVS